MAIDYGFWSSLSTGYQSAQDRRATRDAQSMKELQYMQMLQQQQAQRIDQQNKIQLELDNASAAAETLLHNSFGRQKDVDDMKKWHKDHSGWSDIKNVIEQYNGDYTQARLYGNLDYYIHQYKMNINNPDSDPTKGNPILQRVANNKANLTNYIAAVQSKESQGLVMPGDVDRYNAFISGDTDEFQYAGLRGDWDIATMIQDTDLGKEIDIDTFYSHNMHAILTDMSKDTGIDIGTLQQNPEAVKTWTKDALNWDGAPIYGEKKIETSYVNQFLSNMDELPAVFAEHKGSLGTFTVNDVYDMDQYSKGDKSGFSMLLEGRSEETGEAYSDIWEMLGGYDENVNPHSKLGGQNWIAGHQLMGSGQILTDPALQNAVLKAHYGDSYFAEGKTINDIKVHGLYTEHGHMVTDDDLSDTGWERGMEVGGTGAAVGATVGAVSGGGVFSWLTAPIGAAIGGVVGGAAGYLGFNPYGEEEEMDLNYNGTYLGFRVRVLNDQTGKEESFLITRDSDQSDIDKIKENYGNMPVEVVMINELIDTDYTTSDDMYYDVIDLNNIAFRQQMDAMTDSESLSKVYNESLSYETKQANAAYYTKKQAALNQNMADIYTDGNTEILPQVANTYQSSVSTSLVVGGVSAENAHLTSPMVMSWLLSESEKVSDGNMTKTNELMSKATSTLSTTINSNPQLQEALQGGPKAFMSWYAKNTDKKTFKKFKEKNKQWSKYFTLNK